MVKKNGKSMSPAKRKAVAEASLLRKIKIDDEIKTLEVEVEKTAQDQIKIDREERELKIRKDGHKRLIDQNYRYKKEINKLTGVNKFLAARNKENITATMKDVKESTTILHKLNERIAARETQARQSLDRFQNSFVYLLSKNKCTEELVALHFKTKGNMHRQVEIEREENRKNKLLNELETLRHNLQILLRLDMERKNESKSQTIEEYMDDKLSEFKNEIQSLSKQVKAVNKELVEICSLVDERSTEVSNIKRAIKEIPKKTIEDSKEYAKVLARNKSLQEQLDEHLLRQEKVAMATRNILNQIEDEKRRTTEDSPSEIAIKNLLKLFEQDFKNRSMLEETDRAIIEELKIQNKIRDDYISKTAQVSARMKTECLAEYQKLQALKTEVNVVGNENKVMLDMMMQSSQHMLSSVPSNNSL